MNLKDKIQILHDETKIVLRFIRDQKAIAKSTRKNKLTKIEKHTALLVALYQDLFDSLSKDKK